MENRKIENKKMTDKQIIIHNVDVSKCEWYSSVYFKPCAGCKNTPNCHYKQLARKTAKCEKYKQALDEIEEIIGGTYYETEQTVKFKMQDIQDIINIAKEQS